MTKLTVCYGGVERLLLSLISSFELCQTLTELGSSLIITVRGVASCSIFMNKLILVEKINE